MTNDQPVTRVTLEKHSLVLWHILHGISLMRGGGDPSDHFDYAVSTLRGADEAHRPAAAPDRGEPAKAAVEALGHELWEFLPGNTDRDRVLRDADFMIRRLRKRGFDLVQPTDPGHGDAVRALRKVRKEVKDADTADYGLTGLTIKKLAVIDDIIARLEAEGRQP